MPKRIPTAAFSVLDESNYLAVTNPYPPKANLQLQGDQRALALWLTCCAGRGVLQAIFYRTSFEEMVIIEVNREVERFHELLGQHVWSDFLVDPAKKYKGKSSTIFYSTFNNRTLVKNGWKRVEIEEYWFKGWTDNLIIKYPYPKSSSSSKSGEPVFLASTLTDSLVGSAELPPAAARRSNAGRTPSAVPSVAAKHRTKNDSTSRGKRRSPSGFSEAPAGTSRASSTVGGSNTPLAPPSLAPTRSQAPDPDDWGASVKSFRSKRANRPPASTPAPSFSSHPAPGQIYDPLSPLDPPRAYEYNEEDRPRHSTAAALTDLFDDDFFTPSAGNDTGGAGVPGPEDSEYYPWTPPLDTDAPVVSLPSSTRKGKTAALSDVVSSTSAHSKSTPSLSPSSAKPPTPPSVVANPRTKNNPRKHWKGEPPSVSSKAPAGTSSAPSTVRISSSQPSRVAPSAPPISLSQTAKHLDWSEEVKRFESEQNSPPTWTPALAHSSHVMARQLYDPLMIPLALPRVFECDEDQLRHSMTVTLKGLCNDDFFSSTSGGARVPGANDHDYDRYNPWNAPVDAAASVHSTSLLSILNGKTTAPSDPVPVTGASVISVQSTSPASTQVPAPSPAVAKRRARNNTRKRDSAPVPSHAPATTSLTPSHSTVDSPNARVAPPAPPVGLTQTPKHFGRREDVERFEPEQINGPPASTPAPSHPSHPAQRPCDDPHGPLEPSQDYEYDEEDQPRDSTGAALTDLFDDGFFAEASSVRGGGGANVPSPDDSDYDPWNPPAGTENLWEGYDEPRLEPPTKSKKNGEWTCSQHGSLCTPGICKERGRFERDERMRNERTEQEVENTQRDVQRTRVRLKKEKKGGGKGEQRPPPRYIRRNSSSSSNSDNNSNSGSESDSDTSRDQGSIATLQLDQEDRSIEANSVNAGDADAQSMVSFVSSAWGPVSRADDGDHDEGASVARSRITNTSRSRAARPASVSPSVRSKEFTLPPTPQLSPTSPAPASWVPAWAARGAPNQSPSVVGRRDVLPSPAANPVPAPSTNAEARSRVSSRAPISAAPYAPYSSSKAKDLPRHDPIKTWLADVARERGPPTSAEGRQKSRGGRRGRNKD